MKKIKNILFVLFFLITIPTCQTFGSEQVYVAGSSNSMNTSTTEYNTPFSAGPTAITSWTATEADRQVLMPAAGTLSDLRVNIDGTPGTGNSYAFTVRINGAGSTTITCTISNAETACNSGALTDTVAAGDSVAIEVNPNSGPSARDGRWSLKFDSTTSAYTTLAGCTNGTALATSGTQYLAVHGGNPPDTSSFQTATLFPLAGTLRNLYVELEVAPGAGTSRTFAIGTVDCTIADTATTCNSAGDTQAISAADTFTLTSTVSGTPVASQAKYGVVLTATTAGQFPIVLSSDNTTNTSTTEYSVLSGGDTTWSTAENDSSSLANAMTIKSIYVELSSAPGSGGDAYDFTLRQDTVSSGLTVQLLNTETADNASTDITIADDELLSTECNPSVTPGARTALIAYQGFIDPGGAPAVATQAIMGEIM